MPAAAVATHSVPVRARALTGFAPLVRAHGGDPHALLAAAGLPAALLDEPDSTLPLPALARLLDDAAQALALPDFGMRLAAHQDVNVLGALALILMHAADVEEGMRSVSRYLPYHTPGARLTLADDADPTLFQWRFELDVGAAPRRQIVELSYAVACNFMRLVAPAGASGFVVQLRHRRGAGALAYRRHLGCPVRFEQACDALILPRQLLAAPIDPGRADLRLAAERFVGNVVRRFPLDIRRQVEALAERQLPAGGAGIERIAAQLGLHARTLQRRLAAQGLHYETVIDELRRARALDYLPQAAIPLVQVGELLGYSDQSSFIRACRRWFDATPQQVRARGAVPPAPTLAHHSPVTDHQEH